MTMFVVECLSSIQLTSEIEGQSLIIINLYAKLHAIFSPICEFYCELNYNFVNN